MRKLQLLLTFLLGLVLNAAAQEQIRGTVKDSGNKPLMAANVTLKNSDGNIVTYTRTNEKGMFTLAVPSAGKQMVLEVSMLGFKKAALMIRDKQQAYDFTMDQTAIDIKDVAVTNKPVLKVNGDTLNYRVADFSTKQDRVLGDVLKNMPGIEVAQNGKVSYNGKNISSLYIDGDNMLDDKYNIATKSIPKDAVETVQVIEKDQPIKMLRKKSLSDDVALNIVTSAKARLKPVGQVSVGGGLPGKYDENLNTMIFGKKYKGINYLKGNNVGVDPAQDLISHNLSDYLQRIENNKPQSLLSGGAAGSPDLPQNRYLFNQSALLNVNNMFNFKNDVQLKTNAYYLIDKQDKDYRKYNEIYLPDNTFSYLETQDNVIRPQQLHGQASININRDKNYANNTLMFDFNPSKYQIGMNSNNARLNQQLKQDYFEFSNEFNLYNTLKSGKIVNFYSYINRVNEPEGLLISPGVIAAQVNGGIPYTQLTQNVAIPTWFTNNYASMKFLSGKIAQTYKAGFMVTDQELNSELTIKQLDQSVTAPTINAVNNLNWNKTTAYVEGAFEYKGDKITSTLTLPVSYQHFAYNDKGNDLSEQLDRMYVNPRFSLKYQSGIENFLTLSYSFKNSIGGIDDVYRGAILTNYRSLFANNSKIPEQKNNSAVLGFNYRKAITLFFFNVQAIYSNIASNTIQSSTINNNLQQRILLPLDNQTNVYGLSGSISKYAFALRSTISGGVNITKTNTSQLQNGNLLPFRNLNTGFKAGIISKISSTLNLNYNANYNKINTASGNGIKPPGYQQIRQEGTLSATLFKDLFLNFTATHLLTKQAGQPKLEYLFADINARFKANKINTDFEFGITNLAGIKTYETVYLSANSFTSASYAIPGRVAMLKATFSY